jgi:hypothetical protein
MKPTQHEHFSDLLSHDHARLDAMLSSLLELTHVNAQPALDVQWGAYETSLLAHLDAEEMFLLPGLAKQDSLHADRIRAEHAKIRELLAEVGVGLELHLVRESQMLELARFLREHAKMEQEPLYSWADRAIAQSSFALVRNRLRDTWRRLRPASTPPRAQL